MSGILKFNKNISTRMLLNFFTVFTSAMVMPYTVIYFSDSLGSGLTTGMILIIGAISMVGYLLGGRAADYYGRKIIIILSEIIAGAGFLIITYFDYLSTFYAIPILISFCIIYFFQSAANPAYSALIIDSSSEVERRSIYTYFIWLQSIAFALGSVIGGFYFEGFSVLLFSIMGSTSFISAIFTYILIKEVKPRQLQLNRNNRKMNVLNKEFVNEKPFFLNILNIFTYRLFIYLSLGTFLLSVLSEQIYNYISIRVVENYRTDDFSMTGHQMMGYLHLEDTLIMTLSAGILLKMTKTLSDKASLFLGLILNITGYVILSCFLHPLALLIGMFFIAIGFLIYRPVEQTIIANSIPDNARGKYLSILGLMTAFGGMISGLFIWGSGYISENGISLIFLAMGLVVILNYSNVIKHINIIKSSKNN